MLTMIQPYLLWIKLGMIAAIAMGSFYAGHKITSNAWEAEQAQEYRANMETVLKLAKHAREVGTKLAASIHARTEDAQRHRRSIAAWQDKGTVNVDCQGSGIQAVPEPAVRFGADYIAEWNSGLCLGSIDVAACNRRVADAAASGASVTPGEILDNQGDNAESCGKDRARLGAWQDLALKNGWVTK